MIVVANRPTLRDRVATPYNLNMAPNKMVTYSHTSFHRYDDDDSGETLSYLENVVAVYVKLRSSEA